MVDKCGGPSVIEQFVLYCHCIHVVISSRLTSSASSNPILVSRTILQFDCLSGTQLTWLHL